MIKLGSTTKAYGPPMLRLKMWSRYKPSCQETVGHRRDSYAESASQRVKAFEVMEMLGWVFLRGETMQRHSAGDDGLLVVDVTLSRRVNPCQRAMSIATNKAPAVCSTMHMPPAGRVSGVTSPKPVLMSTVMLR